MFNGMKVALVTACPQYMVILPEACVVMTDMIDRLRGRVSTIIDFSFLTVALFEGRVNADVFYAWMRQ